MPIKPTDPFVLEKSVWTDADFERMSWHDVHIHSFAFDPDNSELLLDIDYMFAWVDPEPPSRGFTFWLAPCTLVFKNLFDFKADLESSLGVLELCGIERFSEPPEPTPNQSLTPKWVLDLQEGEISFLATGFIQYTRRAPIRHSAQHFPLAYRSGVCFDRPPAPRE